MKNDLEKLIFKRMREITNFIIRKIAEFIRCSLILRNQLHFFKKNTLSVLLESILLSLII